MAVKNKQAHFRAPVALNSPHKTPWVALRASLQNFVENPNSFQMVRERGLEPPHLAATAPQTVVSTISPPAHEFYTIE